MLLKLQMKINIELSTPTAADDVPYVCMPLFPPEPAPILVQPLRPSSQSFEEFCRERPKLKFRVNGSTHLLSSCSFYGVIIRNLFERNSIHVNFSFLSYRRCLSLNGWSAVLSLLWCMNIMNAPELSLSLQV
jgi:hypothetical protein